MKNFFIVLITLFVVTSCARKQYIELDGKEVLISEIDVKKASDNRIRLALLYLQNNDMKNAKENLEKAQAFSPNDPDVLRIFAYYYQQVDELSEAEKLYKKAIAIEPNNADTLNNYGVFLCSQKRYLEAEKSFLNAITQPNYTSVADSYENAGICALQAQDSEMAILYNEKAFSHDPTKIYLALKLANGYLDLKQYKKAEINLNKYQKNESETAESLWLFIRLSYATKQSENFNKYASELLKKFPSSQESLNYLKQKYYE